MHPCFVETESRPLSGIFYLKNEISLNEPYQDIKYTNVIFKIENEKVKINYYRPFDYTLSSGMVVIYHNGEAVQKGPLWTDNVGDIRSALNTLTNKFIDIIYGIFGTKWGYVADNNEIWNFRGKIDNIQQIGFETNNSIRMRSATYHK